MHGAVSDLQNLGREIARGLELLCTHGGLTCLLFGSFLAGFAEDSGRGGIVKHPQATDIDLPSSIYTRRLVRHECESAIRTPLGETNATPVQHFGQNKPSILAGRGLSNPAYRYIMSQLASSCQWSVWCCSALRITIRAINRSDLSQPEPHP